MDAQRKRDLVRDYKERKPSRGAFAVRCAASGQSWVSASKDLDKQQNRIWFSLGSGSHPNRELQAAWKAHGREAFAFEVLEQLDDAERDDYALRADLKTLEESWREKLNAKAVAG